MKKTISLLTIALLLIATLNSCDKDENGDNLTGRDAILGTYDFTNNYSLYNWNSSLMKVDTVNGTQTYIITVDKPNPDNLGDNVVVITNLLKKQSTIPVQATLSSSGDVLTYTGNPADLEFVSFQGVKSGSNITFNFTAYGPGTPNGISESGSGTAVKR